MTPDLIAEFIAEYTAEWNRLQQEERGVGADRARKLADVNRRIAAMLEALEQGVITPTTKERLEDLEKQKTGLLATAEVTVMPALHPNLARLYSEAVARLHEELANPDLASKARSVLRSLIKTIVVRPGTSRGEVKLELHGELATILQFAQGAKDAGGKGRTPIQVSVVAGVGFEPTTFRL